METRRRKRFIAGAVCPQCQSADTMMLYMEHGVEKVECVNCGHHQSQAEAKTESAAGGDIIGIFRPE
ncbi:YheV family putative zinc ribbon protein [Oceanimonas baumannii]|uniref:DNA-binding protein n=1 Tax=Oceanimonas baumannii TaxID=129578 RepID=A0A235CEF6_9GAMM|nr:YheV family putative zinc ribbon protein [Oceanimonas baumannii]MCC4265472.1 YheV family putative metal-binding protein [Oceanimonas baumannii]OYD22912.1 DNA-binding protein [Oceanimonas baumannii]